MTISVTVTGDSADAMIADLQRIFPALVAGTPLPPMQEQPKPEVVPPKKDTKKTAEKKPETIEATKNVDQPDLETVRAKLKSLGATEGLGHDKVFEVLGKYGAKNASTVPEGRRAEIVAEIDALIAGAK